MVSRGDECAIIIIRDLCPCDASVKRGCEESMERVRVLLRMSGEGIEVHVYAEDCAFDPCIVCVQRIVEET